MDVWTALFALLVILSELASADYNQLSVYYSWGQSGNKGEETNRIAKSQIAALFSSVCTQK